MSALETAKITKGNVSLIQYLDENPEKHFVQVGVVGLFATKDELLNLHTVLNYYLNIEKFSDCTIKIGEEYVTIR